MLTLNREHKRSRQEDTVGEWQMARGGCETENVGSTLITKDFPHSTSGTETSLG